MLTRFNKARSIFSSVSGDDEMATFEFIPEKVFAKIGIARRLICQDHCNQEQMIKMRVSPKVRRSMKSVKK